MQTLALFWAGNAKLDSRIVCGLWRWRGDDDERLVDDVEDVYERVVDVIRIVFVVVVVVGAVDVQGRLRGV